MPNILFLSENALLKNDLSEQIKLYAPEFEIFYEENDKTRFDMLVVDENLEKLKNLEIKAPIFLLTQNEENPEISVNQTFIKPFKLNEFLNSIKAGIALYENSTEGYLVFNQYELRPISKEIVNKRNQEVIKLTEKEVAILKYLYKSQDHIVSKGELLQEVWEYNPEASTHTIETHIYRLRQKVEQDDTSAQLIVTEDGGYLLKI